MRGQGQWPCRRAPLRWPREIAPSNGPLLVADWFRDRPHPTRRIAFNRIRGGPAVQRVNAR